MNALRPHLFELARFGIVGALNTFLGLAVIYALMAVGVGLYLANLLGYAFGLVVSFTLNRNWTFRSDERVQFALIGRFAIAVAISYGANLAVVHMCARLGLNPYLAQLMGLPAYTLCFYLMSKFFVFRKTAVTYPGH